MRALMLAALATLPPSVHPWPIGAGPRCRPPAVSSSVRAERPVGRYRCGRAPARFAVHVELFANRRAVVIPAGIGIARGCFYPLRTTTPTGVVEVGAREATVGDLFRIWGQPLGARRLLSFRSSQVAVFVGGRRQSRDPRFIPLTRHAQIVLEIGGLLPPHPSFLFPKGTP